MRKLDLKNPLVLLYGNWQLLVLLLGDLKLSWI